MVPVHSDHCIILQKSRIMSIIIVRKLNLYISHPENVVFDQVAKVVLVAVLARAVVAAKVALVGLLARVVVAAKVALVGLLARVVMAAKVALAD